MEEEEQQQQQMSNVDLYRASIEKFREHKRKLRAKKTELAKTMKWSNLSWNTVPSNADVGVNALVDYAIQQKSNNMEEMNLDMNNHEKATPKFMESNSIPQKLKIAARIRTSCQQKAHQYYDTLSCLTLLMKCEESRGLNNREAELSHMNKKIEACRQDGKIPADCTFRESFNGDEFLDYQANMDRLTHDIHMFHDGVADRSSWGIDPYMFDDCITTATNRKVEADFNFLGSHNNIVTASDTLKPSLVVTQDGSGHYNNNSLFDRLLLSDSYVMDINNYQYQTQNNCNTFNQ